MSDLTVHQAILRGGTLEGDHMGKGGDTGRAYYIVILIQSLSSLMKDDMKRTLKRGSGRERERDQWRLIWAWMDGLRDTWTVGDT